MRPSPAGEAGPPSSHRSSERGLVRAAGNALVLVAVPASLFWFPIARVPGLGNVSASDAALIALWGITALELLVRADRHLDVADVAIPVLAVAIGALAGIGSELGQAGGGGVREVLRLAKIFGLATVLPLATSLFRSRRTDPYLRAFTALSLAALAIFSLSPDLQALLPRPDEHDAELLGDRATGLVTNPNDLAYASVALVVLHAALLPRRANLRDGAVLAACFACAALCLVTSGSRSGMLGALGAVAVVATSSRFGRTTKLALAAGVVVTFVAGLAGSTVFEERLQRLWHGATEEQNVAGRINAQVFALRIAWTHPLGVGYANFDRESSSRDAPRAFGTSDSLYVDTLLGAGFVGLGLLVLLLRAAWRRIGSEGDDPRRVRLLRAGMVAFFLFGTASRIPMSVFLAPLFFTLAAAGRGESVPARAERTSCASSSPIS